MVSPTATVCWACAAAIAVSAMAWAPRTLRFCFPGIQCMGPQDGQAGVCCHGQGDVAVPARVAAGLVVVYAPLLLQLVAHLLKLLAQLLSLQLQFGPAGRDQLTKAQFRIPGHLAHLTPGSYGQVPRSRRVSRGSVIAETTDDLELRQPPTTSSRARSTTHTSPVASNLKMVDSKLEKAHWGRTARGAAPTSMSVRPDDQEWAHWACRQAQLLSVTRLPGARTPPTSST